MKLYVPNPQVWVDFFDRLSRGKATLNQTGGGRRPRVITVTPPTPSQEKQVAIKAVLPTEQTAAQAKSALEREDINPKSVEKAFQSLSESRTSNRKRKSKVSESNQTKRQREKDKPRETAKQKRRGSRQNRSQFLNIRGRRDIFEIK